MTRVTIAVCAALSVLSGAAHAQSIQLSPPDAPRWEVSGSAGWLASDKSPLAPRWNDWYDTGSFAAALGYYWTRHVKAELEVSTSGEAVVHEQLQVDVPGFPTPVYHPRYHHFRQTALSAAVAYQFFENATFHPFVAGGVEFSRERDRAETLYRVGVGSNPLRPVLIPDRDEEAPVYSHAVRPVGTAGFKVFVGERAFVRTDMRVVFGGGGASHFTWRGGVGVEF